MTELMTMQPENPLRILVVDDARENLIIIRKFLSQMGHIPISAMNGREAIELFQSEAPDLVLMDVMMPDMDGYEATARIKAFNPAKWVPVVFLSALDQEESLVKGLEAGGDDYLTKPVHFLTLQAKINAMQRIAKLQRQIREKAHELEQYYFNAEEEKRISAHLMNHMISAEGLRDPMLHYRILPAEHYSGDLVAAARSPADVLYVLLADGTGHGLAAAINVLPLTHIFYGMVKKGFPLATVVVEMNDKIKAFLPGDRFIAATVMAVDTRTKLVEIWNGGNPDALFVANNGSILRQFESQHLPLGVMDPREFDSATEVFHYSHAGQLFLCSDGLVEAENEKGEFFGWDSVLVTLAGSSRTERFEQVQSAFTAHLAGQKARDDISLMLVDLPEDERTAIVLPAKSGIDNTKPGCWKMEISLGVEELRYFDLIPEVMSVIGKLNGIKPHLSPLFVIVSELFSNSLDHGLLALNSHLKSNADGFDRYLTERDRRLAELEDGSIWLGFEQISVNGERLLKIQVKDSGAGFDHATPDFGVHDNLNLFGRGIALIRSLSAKVEYLGCGNEVVVYYRL